MACAAANLRRGWRLACAPPCPPRPAVHPHAIAICRPSALACGAAFLPMRSSSTPSSYFSSGYRGSGAGVRAGSDLAAGRAPGAGGRRAGTNSRQLRLHRSMCCVRAVRALAEMASMSALSGCARPAAGAGIGLRSRSASHAAQPAAAVRRPRSPSSARGRGRRRRALHGGRCPAPPRPPARGRGAAAGGRQAAAAGRLGCWHRRDVIHSPADTLGLGAPRAPGGRIAPRCRRQTHGSRSCAPPGCLHVAQTPAPAQ